MNPGVGFRFNETTLMSMNRIDRLMATILLLQGRRVITAGDIAGHFGISLRTVYRDIASLSEGGVPIVAEAGVKMHPGRVCFLTRARQPRRRCYVFRDR